MEMERSILGVTTNRPYKKHNIALQTPNCRCSSKGQKASMELGM